jgi:hypothetical protein
VLLLKVNQKYLRRGIMGWVLINVNNNFNQAYFENSKEVQKFIKETDLKTQ